MSTTSVDEERRRKRLRKGTFSCWECKRRKVRCKYENDQSICVGCAARGSICLSQEYPEDHKSLPENNSNVIGERLSRVEKVLEKLVNKIGVTEDGRHMAAEALESLGIDVLHHSNSHENAPIYSLFDNAVFGRSKNDEEKPSASSTGSMSTPISLPEHPANSVPSKLETISGYLASLLPKQEAVDAITEAGNGWWIVKSMQRPFVDQYLLGLDSVRMLSRRHPIIVARALLYIVLSVQQLPSSFDRHQLGFSCAALMEKCHAAVSSRVLMDDELIGSIEGIECLILQGIYHINAAMPRSAWLSMRRAINICQLLGIHRKSGRSAKEGEAMSASYLEEVWCLALAADRYLSLILGLPYGVHDLQGDCNIDLNPSLSAEERYQRQVISISGQIIDRNSAPLDYTQTEDIERRLDEVGSVMPESWWQLPSGPTSESTSLGFGRTSNASALFDRLMAQIWHFQLKALLHLPFMLRSEPCYEKSVAKCLEASRQLIRRYIFFRKSNEGCFCCKIVDFQAFTAATTLLLDLLGPIPLRDGNFQQQKDEDWKLVKDVTGVLGDLAKEAPDIVATQSLKILNTLQTNQSDSNMKLTIPYFGTVSISRSPRPSYATSKSTTSLPNNSGSSKFLRGPNVTQNSQPVPYQQQQQQQVFNLTQEQYLTQQAYTQQFPVVSFTNDTLPRNDLENESLWGDWMLQDSTGVPFQNMFDPNLSTSWYLESL